MNYTNQHQVRFKILRDRDWYVVKYFSGKTRRPRRYFTFHCAYETQLRQMMYILSTVKLCPDCLHETVTIYDCCPECKLRRIAREPDPPMEHCKVCYIAVFEADHTLQKLSCNCIVCHVCKVCLQNMDWVRNQMYIDCAECKIKSWL